MFDKNRPAGYLLGTLLANLPYFPPKLELESVYVVFGTPGTIRQFYTDNYGKIDGNQIVGATYPETLQGRRARPVVIFPDTSWDPGPAHEKAVTQTIDTIFSMAQLYGWGDDK